MAKYRRLVVTDYPHHVTQRGVRRQTTFFEADDYQAYLGLAHDLLRHIAVDIWAYCLMPNHIHAVAVPRTEGALSKFFATLHRRYARRTNQKHNWSGHLWQERYYSVVLDDSHALSAMRYVELNPVRAGLVKSAFDWPWSSARGHLGLAEDPLVDSDATRALVHDWARFLETPDRPAEFEELRRQTRVGRPRGRDAFVRKIEALSGRRVRRRPRRKR